MKVDLLRVERLKDLELTTEELLELTGKGWTVQAIDDKDFIGLCHFCNKPVLEGEPSCRGKESGVLLCSDCIDEEHQE